MSEGLTVVIDRRDLQLSVEHNALRIDHPDGHFQRLPIPLLANLVVYGSPQVRCDVWRKLAEHGVPAVLMPGRGKGDSCWMGAGLASFVHWRQRQFASHACGMRRLAVARWMVQRKFAAKQALLARVGAPAEPVAATLARFGEDAAGARDNASLMGIEGSAARVWYGWMKQRIAAEWNFKGRNRRPPRDPVNALLSLGYTLAVGVMIRHVAAAGFDPYLGFLHEVAPARPALALDLAEALRPGVDAFVIGLTGGVMVPADFSYSETEGCRLSKDARARFYAAWSAWCAQWPEVALSGRAEESVIGEEATPEKDDNVVGVERSARRIVAAFQAELRSPGAVL